MFRADSTCHISFAQMRTVLRRFRDRTLGRTLLETRFNGVSNRFLRLRMLVRAFSNTMVARGTDAGLPVGRKGPPTPSYVAFRYRAWLTTNEEGIRDRCGPCLAFAAINAFTGHEGRFCAGCARSHARASVAFGRALRRRRRLLWPRHLACSLRIAYRSSTTKSPETRPMPDQRPGIA